MWARFNIAASFIPADSVAGLIPTVSSIAVDSREGDVGARSAPGTVRTYAREGAFPVQRLVSSLILPCLAWLASGSCFIQSHGSLDEGSTLFRFLSVPDPKVGYCS